MRIVDIRTRAKLGLSFGLVILLVAIGAMFNMRNNLRFNKLIGLADKCTFLPVSLSSALKYDCSGTALARF